MSQHTTRFRRAEPDPLTPVPPTGPPQPAGHPPDDQRSVPYGTSALVPQWNPDDGDFG